MPEKSLIMKPKQARPTSDIIMEAGRKLLSEMEKASVEDSNKHVSLLLARSRSLDVLSSLSTSSTRARPPPLDKSLSSGGRNIGVNDHNGNDITSLTYSPVATMHTERLNLYVTSGTSFVTGRPSALATLAHSPPASSSSSKNNYDGVMSDNNLACQSMILPTCEATSSQPKDLTLLKDTPESNMSYNNSSRSSSISTSSSSSSGTSTSKSDSKKAYRRSSSTTEGGSSATAFQEMVLNDNEPIRITGYLEKRSKVLGWKKFWFVLDGRLLTYYKSKADYDSLSACCGCINLGIASTVRPIQIRGCKGYPLQIVTRSQVYYLRSQEKPVLEQWLIAIQEASSSPPSSTALTSWGSCLGSEYFRHSFASQSQWSLNQSSEDIADISHRVGILPDTFYQRRDRGSLTGSNLSHGPPVIQKYHSFASLQTPVINNFDGNSHLRRRGIVSSTENLRDLHETNNRTMQQSTSLLVLDSSPQAAELRKELTRKLSIGSTNNSGGVADSGGGDEDEVPTPKFLLSSVKKRSVERGSGDDESHHYAEIGDYVEGTVKRHYENCEAEKFAFSLSAPQTQSGSIKRSVARAESVEKDGNIYEHVENMDPPSNMASTIAPVWEPIGEGNNGSSKRFHVHRLSSGSNRNSLVSISELPEDISSASPSPIKTPVLSSIPEASWQVGGEPYKSYGKTYSEDDLSSCRSESFRSLPCAEKSSKKRKGKAFGGFFSKVFGKHRGKGNKSDSSENLHRPMIISGPVDLRKQVQMQEIRTGQSERRPPFSKKPSIEIPPDVINRNTAVTSAGNEESENIKTSPTTVGYRMTVNNSNVMDELKQKVGHITLKRTGSRSNSGSESESPSKENTENLTQQKRTIEPRPLNIVEPPATTALQPIPVLQLQQQDSCMESNTDDNDSVTPPQEKETQVASMSLHNEMSSSEMEKVTQTDSAPCASPQTLEETKVDQMDPKLPSEIVPRLANTVVNEAEADFQNKLAKFNSLSKRLSATFIAALQPPHANSIYGGGPMTRSNSYKTQRYNNKGAVNEEMIPPLPPKKKNIGSSSGAIPPLYDIPLNNKPVSNQSKPCSIDNLDQKEGKSIGAFIRDLTKKNSTPDIVLSNSFFHRDNNSSKEEAKDSRSSSGSDENFEVHKSSPTIPPPRPPKPKPPAKPKSLEAGLNRIKRVSESSSSSEGGNPEQPPSILTVVFTAPTLLQLPQEVTASPAASNKSLDLLDTLDALSEAGLSDTKASSSPSDSPKICPLHMGGSEAHDDFALSSDAITPQSTVSIVPDSLATTPDMLLDLSFSNLKQPLDVTEPDSGPISVNKLEIVIRDNDGSPGLIQKSPDNESRMDSLERNTPKPSSTATSTPSETNAEISSVYQNLKFATVNTIFQEYETVEENEDEMSELYDDFPAEFYTPTPSSFSGYSPSEGATTSTDSSPILSSPAALPFKKHARLDAIRHTGMEQLEAFLGFRSNTASSDESSFESCIDSIPEDGGPSKLPGTPVPLSMSNNNKDKTPMQGGSHFHTSGSGPHPTSVSSNRTGAISRLGHSSAIGHLQKILTSDVK